MPTTTDTFDWPNYNQNLMTVEPQDDVLFEMMRRDQNWPGHLPVEPFRKVQVNVYNTTGQGGLAASTAASLRRLGFKVLKVSNAPFISKTTVTYRGIDRADSAYTLMTELRSFPAGENLMVPPHSRLGSWGPVNLYIGADFAGVKPPAPKTTQVLGKGEKKHHKTTGSQSATEAAANPNSTGPGSVESRNAAANICSGLPKGFR
jgi:hypothetical protein